MGNKALNSIGIDLGQIAEETYDYANKIANINDIETENFNNLPESAKVQMTNEGKYPGGPNWNEFLNEMSSYYLSDFSNKIGAINKMDYKIYSIDVFQAIADKFQITKEELLAKNPWLKEQGRISNDGKYILILGSGFDF